MKHRLTKREEKERALKALRECNAKGEKEMVLDGLEHKHIHCENDDDEPFDDSQDKGLESLEQLFWLML